MRLLYHNSCNPISHETERMPPFDFISILNMNGLGHEMHLILHYPGLLHYENSEASIRRRRPKWHRCTEYLDYCSLGTSLPLSCSCFPWNVTQLRLILQSHRPTIGNHLPVITKQNITEYNAFFISNDRHNKTQQKQFKSYITEFVCVGFIYINFTPLTQHLTTPEAIKYVCLL